MLGFIEIIISAVGVLGFFSDNFICCIIGLIGIIICDFIDIFVLEHNPTSIFISIILGVGASIANHDPLSTFTILLCGENLIMSILTLSFICISFLINKYHSKQNKKDNNVLDINSIMNNQDMINNIIAGKETVDLKLFVGKQNPYTGELIDNYYDIIKYFKMYQLDYNNIDPLTYKEEGFLK